nr:putative CRISPR-associated protein [Thermoanaerobacterium thermosaccharolyticum]
MNFYSKNRSEDISAEIKSVKKISEYLKEDIDVYLIATDTIVSSVAADIIKKFLEDDGFIVKFNPNIDIIKGLQVKNKEQFISEGLSNLIKRINEILKEEYYGNAAFNISGGYKAIIPYFTMMAQINGCDTYYIFEDTEELISIPAAPITIDIEMFEKYNREFTELSSCIDNYSKWRENHYEFVNKARSCIEIADNIACLSPIGEILWGNYKSRYNIFFATKNVIEKIKNNKILAQKVVKFLSEDNIRDEKTEIKGLKIKHKVYDDGNNNYRIVYDQRDDQIYIYAIFDYEPDEIKFINDPKQSNRIEDYDFIQYKIDKQSLMIDLLIQN